MADAGGWSTWLKDAERREGEGPAAAVQAGAARRLAGLPPPVLMEARGPRGAACGRPLSLPAAGGRGRLRPVQGRTPGGIARRALAKSSAVRPSLRRLRRGQGRPGARSARDPRDRSEPRGGQPPTVRARGNAPHRRARPADGPPDPVRNSHAGRRDLRLTERVPGRIARALRQIAPARRRIGPARRRQGHAQLQTDHARGETDRATGETDHATGRRSAPRGVPASGPRRDPQTGLNAGTREPAEPPKAGPAAAGRAGPGSPASAAKPRRISSRTGGHGFRTRSPPSSSTLRPGRSCAVCRTTWPTAWLGTS